MADGSIKYWMDFPHIMNPDDFKDLLTVQVKVSLRDPIEMQVCLLCTHSVSQQLLNGCLLCSPHVLLYSTAAHISHVSSFFLFFALFEPDLDCLPFVLGN